jgi:hypothetical protein
MKPKTEPTKKSWLEKLLKYTFAVFLVFVPLYPKFPLVMVPGSSVAIRTEDLIIMVMAVLLLGFYKQFLKMLRNDNLLWMILCFILIGLISVISGAFITKTASLSTSLLHWARRVEYLIPFFAGLVLAKRENLRFFMELMVVVTIGVLIYGIGQIYLNFPVISTQNEEYSKGIALTLTPGVNISSTFAGHYDLAAFLVMNILLFVSMLFYMPRKYWLPGGALIMAFYWLFMQTGQRIAFGALMVTLPLLLVLIKKHWYIPLVVILMLVGAANSPKLMGRFYDIFQIIQVRSIQDKVKGAWDSRTLIVGSVHAAQEVPVVTPTPEPLRAVQLDRSFSIRSDVEWPRAIRALTKNPILGTGYNSITLATDNDYLRALGETGLLGFVSFMGIILSVLAKIIWTVRNTDDKLVWHYCVGTLVLVIAVLLIAVFIDIFEASKNATMIWAYTGLASGFYYAKKNR